MADELLQWDGTLWRDYGPDTPEHEPIYLIDTRGKWIQVSDLRPGHPTAQGVLTAAKHWPIPAANVAGKGSHESWIPPLLLAERRMWTGTRWIPGESTVKDIHPHAETNYPGSKLEFTQVLDAGPSVGGPALGTISSPWTSAPRMRLFAHLKQTGHTTYLWYEYKEGAWHANNHHQVANGMTHRRVVVAGKPDEYRWNVAIGAEVAKEIAGRYCFLLIDGEQEYGPWLVLFLAAVPWTAVIATPPKVTGVHVVHNTYSAGKVNLTMRWNSVSCSSGSVTYRIYLNGKFNTTRSSAEMVTVLGHPGSTYNYQVAAVCGGKEGPKSSVLRVVAARAPAAHHTPTSHTLTVPIKWDAAYDGNHHRRSDHVSNPWQDHLVVGRYGSVHGNTHSVVRFDLSHIPKGAHITSIKLRVYADHWFSNSGGTLRVRYSTARAGSPPSSHTPTTGWYSRTIHWTTKTGYKEVTLENSDSWVSGSVNSLQFQSTTTSQSGYGVLAAKGTRKPRLIITYTI